MTLQPPDPRAAARQFGKYRGTVTQNTDPQRRGRLQVSVPAVYGTNTQNWALPALPYAGKDVGLYLIPPVGANVWVEFEGGDISFPIWTGCFWAEGECPSQTPQTLVLKTPAGILTFDEMNKQAPVTLKIDGGPTLTLGASVVTIENGAGAKIELSGTMVALNTDGLQVLS